MLPKHLRLPARQIPLVAYKGQKKDGKFIAVRFLAHDKLEHPQFAITVSTKASKSAVERNRIRRILKVKLEELLTSGKINTGKYLLLVRTPEVDEADLLLELENLIAK
jgi:ribonuclease P protein component